jgi:hypothetical protein
MKYNSTMSAITQFNTTSSNPSVSNARQLIDTSVRSTCTKLAKLIGEAFNRFVVAQIAQINDIIDIYEGEPAFDDDELKNDKVYQTFDNITSVSPGSAKQPVTMTTEARMMITALVLGIADLINNFNHVSPTDPLNEIAEQGVQQSAIVRTMLCSIKASREHLNMEYLSYDFDYPSEIGKYIEQLVDANQNSRTHVAVISTTVVDFIKVVAMFAATRGYAFNKLTVNGKELQATIAMMGIFLPEGESSITQDVTMYIKQQMFVWDSVIAQEKLLKSPRKARVTKAAVAATAATVAVSATIEAKNNDTTADSDIDAELAAADSDVAASQDMNCADDSALLGMLQE